MPEIDLIVLSGAPTPTSWGLGRVYVCPPEPEAVRTALAEASHRGRYLFVWDSRLGFPDSAAVKRTAGLPGDAWHAGLCLGLRRLPQAIDFVDPVWMLNRDSDSGIVSSSWRLSLRCCLLSPRCLIPLAAGFDSLDAAGLELGHRLIKSGAVLRHVPGLASGAARLPSPALTLQDEMKFLALRYGVKWLCYAAARMAMSGYAAVKDILVATRAASKLTRPEVSDRFKAPAPIANAAGVVSVLIPTIDRYVYLEKLLPQLQAQTRPALEIVIVDQTHPSRRRQIATPDGPTTIRVLTLDRSGQCTSRNAGLLQVKGDCVLFLDDDDEVQPDLIERHLANLEMFRADVSAGVADEVGAGPLPADFRFLRVSNVFPTNNAMIRRRTLEHSGLFDLAYDKGQRADGDLGMRMYLAGALMILNPEISVFHHHAPMGGLRTHKARKITYASSRQSIWQRHLPSATEIYLMRRYYDRIQMREALWQRAIGTLSASGSVPRRMAKAVVALIMMPDTVRRIRAVCREGDLMTAEYPRIPKLGAAFEASV